MERSSIGSGRRMTGFVRHVVVWAVGMVAGTVVAFPVGVMGLVVPGIVVVPLTFGAAAIAAAVGVLWTATLLDRCRTRGRPLPVIAIPFLTAVVLSAVDPAMRHLAGPHAAVSMGTTYLVAVAVISFNASIATWRHREPGRDLRRDALLTLALLVLVPLVVSAVVAATCSLGVCSG